MRYAGVVLLLITAVLMGCSSESEGGRARPISADDAEFNAAMEHARATVGEFLARLQNPQPGDAAFSVKTRVEDQGTVEHFWLTDVQYSGGVFTGKLGNDPEHVHNVAFGQELSVPENEIGDWMYLDEGRLVGNFTFRVTLERMPEEQARAIRAEMGIDE